jgi:hypothetical protein
MRLPWLLIPVALLLTGCAALSNACGGSLGAPVLVASPATATVSSSATAPANQTQFRVSDTYPNSTLHGECAISNVVVGIFPEWTNPDPVHIDISSAVDTTNGTATCKGPTVGPVTLTATAGTGTSQQVASVQLTCQ